MTERPDPDTAPVPGPGDADPGRGDAPAGDPVPAPFADPDVEQPPVEEDRPGARAAGAGETAEVPAVAAVPPATGVPADPLTGGTAGAPLTETTAPPVEAGPTIDADSGQATTAPLGGAPAYTPPAPGEPAPAPAWDGATTAQANTGADRPELLVAAAFAGGLLFALILKRLGR